MGSHSTCRETGFYYFLLVHLCFGFHSAFAAHETCEDVLRYPQSPQEAVIDDYHGHLVADAFRWLEDLNARRTRSWVSAQNQVTENFLDSTGREGIARRLAQLWNYENYVKEFSIGDHKFAMAREGQQNHPVLYVRRKGSSERQALIDPNKMAADGTIHLSHYQISPNGKYVVYALSSGGSDWATVRIRDVETGRDLDDIIKWTKFTGFTWTPDSKGFYYSRYPRPITGTEMTASNENNKLYFHTLGTVSSKDALIFGNDAEKDWSFSSEIISAGKYLLVTVSRNTDDKSRLFIKNLQPATAAEGEFVSLIDNFESGFTLVHSSGDKGWFLTNDSAPRGKVVKIDFKKPEKLNWITIISETNDVIQGVNLINRHWVVHALEGAASKLLIYNRDQSLNHVVDLPGQGTVSRISAGENEDEVEFTYSNEVMAPTVYRYHLITKAPRILHRVSLPIDLSQFEVRSVSYASKDGTPISMRIICKKNVVLNGTNPTYLYGYGGFNNALTPAFTVGYFPFLEKGGVVAIPHLRGGGEYGEDWHRAGKLNQKQNVFDDFIAAAEYLIAQKYTSPSKLAIGGASNGGLLVSAVLMQRPELFGAAVPNVGVHDMLRFHVFTVGNGWVGEYGNATSSAQEFNTLYRYSPLHNVTMGVVFPATMVMTGDHDDRVVPSHSYKLAATMQTVQAGRAPVLLRVDHRAGHGAGRPMSKVIQFYADQWGFLLRALGVE